MKHQVSCILRHEADIYIYIYIRSHYCNPNGAFLFQPEGRLTLRTANCNSCDVILMELEVWLFSSVTFTMNNSVNNVRSLKCSFLNKSAASWMDVASLPRESYVTLHSDVCDIPVSFQVQWRAVLLMAFKTSNYNTLS
jgi:hypothetical protein